MPCVSEVQRLLNLEACTLRSASSPSHPMILYESTTSFQMKVVTRSLFSVFLGQHLLTAVANSLTSDMYSRCFYAVITIVLTISLTSYRNAV